MPTDLQIYRMFWRSTTMGLDMKTRDQSSTSDVWSCVGSEALCPESSPKTQHVTTRLGNKQSYNEWVQWLSEPFRADQSCSVGSVLFTCVHRHSLAFSSLYFITCRTISDTKRCVEASRVLWARLRPSAQPLCTTSAQICIR